MTQADESVGIESDSQLPNPELYLDERMPESSKFYSNNSIFDLQNCRKYR